MKKVFEFDGFACSGYRALLEREDCYKYSTLDKVRVSVEEEEIPKFTTTWSTEKEPTGELLITGTVHDPAQFDPDTEYELTIYVFDLEKQKDRKLKLRGVKFQAPLDAANPYKYFSAGEIKFV